MFLVLENNVKLIHFHGVIFLTYVPPYPCKDRFSLRTRRAPSIHLQREPSQYFAGFEQVAVAGSLQTVKVKKEEPLIVNGNSKLKDDV